VIPLLILRPERGAIVTAKRAEALGMSPMIRSLFTVEPRGWDAPDPALFDSILLTSANAVRFGGAAVGLYRALPAFTVGAATAQATRDAGFAEVIESAGDAAEALRTLAASGHSRPIHLAGEDRTAYPHLPFTVMTRTVYAAAPADVALPTGRYAALVHSARAAVRFAALCPTPDLVDVVAISATAAAQAGPGWHSVTIAPEPTDNAMLALAAMLCDGKMMANGQS
jgi:uroporphyrinogen-III synthase